MLASHPMSRQIAALALARTRQAKAQEATVLPWSAFARNEQLPPVEDFRTWLILAGRGWGKSRTGAETIDGWVREGNAHRIGVIAQTAADARDVSVAALMTRIVGRDEEGKPIIGKRPGVKHEPSKRKVTWDNGAEAITFSAEDPDSIRGYNLDTAWLDEVAVWRYPESYDQLQLALRTGWARQIVTTTPRPVTVIRDLLAAGTTIATRGRTMDNRDNLSASALAYLEARYAGTRLGRQELEGELLIDVPGALWTLETIHHGHAPMLEKNGRVVPNMSRVVVAVDPNTTSDEGADEAGITVHGLDFTNHGWLLADRSAAVGPMAWAKRAVQAAEDFDADYIVAEQNQGGEMVRLTIEQVSKKYPVRLVTASKGKRTRAEPVAMLCEQGRISHADVFKGLEDQLLNWTPESGDSPDRLDAYVWGFTDLMLDNHVSGSISMVA